MYEDKKSEGSRSGLGTPEAGGPIDPAVLDKIGNWSSEDWTTP